MHAIYGLWLAVAAMLLAACGADGAPDYRYRLTVEVEIPEGLAAGSSVIEVEQRLVRPGSDPSGIGVERRVRGEAVTVDLPDGRVLFALLRSESANDWASYILPWIAPDVRGESFTEQLDDPLSLKGEIELPKTLPAKSILSERPGYPMLVTFGDINDPTSIERVDPDDLAASFGEGVTLKRITVQITDDPVTAGIEDRLEWLPNYYDKQLSGDRFQMLKNEHKGLSAFISAGVFSAGLGLNEKRAD